MRKLIAFISLIVCISLLCACSTDTKSKNMKVSYDDYVLYILISTQYKDKYEFYFLDENKLLFFVNGKQNTSKILSEKETETLNELIEIANSYDDSKDEEILDYWDVYIKTKQNECTFNYNLSNFKNANELIDKLLNMISYNYEIIK